MFGDTGLLDSKGLLLAEITEHIAPFCYGYMTQYWFGLFGPMPNKPTLQCVNNNGQPAVWRNLEIGVCVAILRNGIVRFDFENYENGGVFIYREKKTPEGSQALHGRNIEAHEKEVQDFAYGLIQVHALLLDNSRRILEHASSHAARPTKHSEMLTGYDLSDPVRQLNPDFKYWVPLPDEVAQKSIDDLAAALSNDEGLFHMLEIYAFSSSHFLERRFAEALISYWAVIEACINVMWERLLTDEKNDPEIGLSGRRRDRLTNPSSYTASVMIETLFLLRKIPFDIYEKLNSAREKRNKWMHKLQPVKEVQALEARKACEELILFTFGFEIEGTISGVGGAGGGLYKHVFCQRYPDKANLFDAS
ncbi:hypothetical protein IWQ49_003055 [Labrenzia sp. EL_126]|nr:hypothetical protein [Labrenzia sp. EL_126]